MQTDDFEIEYVGFWRRFGASIIDSIIWGIPFYLVLAHLSGDALKIGFICWGVFHFFSQIWYRVYLVVRIGGTFGLRALVAKIKSLDGSPITLRQAFLRDSVYILFQILFLISNIQVISTLNDSQLGQGIGALMLTMADELPAWAKVAMAFFKVWGAVDMFSVLFNPKKRSISDFIANTVIVGDPPKQVFETPSNR